MSLKETQPAVALDPAHVAALLDMSADAILTLAPDERITSWNRGAHQMFGWSAEEVLGRDFTVLLPDQERERGELEWIHRTTLAEGAIRDYETRRRHKDGTIIEVSLTRTAVFDDAGRLIGFTAVLRDIGYRKRLERELLAAERLKTAGQVSAGVAHEIGAPLTAISMTVDNMLRKRCDLCVGAAEMHILQQQADRIARLARQLVNLAKPAMPVLVPLQVNDAAAAAVALVRSQLTRHGVTVVLDLAPDLPPVNGDDAQLQQVLVNLLLNADRALDGRGGKVRVTTRRDGEEVEIRVADTGPGIPAAQLPQVFTPFYSATGGAGLGLALTAQIVKAHGGTVEAASPPGQGAVITIRLPVSDG
jgi:two-component system sporulation sensor kinase A